MVARATSANTAVAAQPSTAPTAAPSPTPQKAPAQAPAPQVQVASFEDALQILADQGELLAREALKFDARLVRFEQGRIALQDNVGVKPDQTHKLAKALRAATGEQWIVELVEETGAEPIRAREQQEAAAERDAVSKHPIVAAVLNSFPKASIVDIKDLNKPDIDELPASESLSSDASDDVPFDPEDPGFDTEDLDF